MTHTATTLPNGSTKYTTFRRCATCSNNVDELRQFTAYRLRRDNSSPQWRNCCDQCMRVKAQARYKKPESSLRTFEPSNVVWYYVSNGKRNSRRIYDIADAFRALNLLAVFVGPRGELWESCKGNKSVIYSLRKEL